MLTIGVQIGSKCHRYATQHTALETLKIIADLGRKQENKIRAIRALDGFEAAELHKKPSGITVILSRETFGVTDQIQVRLEGRVEYYRMSDLIKLFFCDCPE